ncbi:hypothetical protein RIVM261_041290 [Rivularia sp. IAM M-261]|nr:hypothetical protein RIVM261_041290 [Rivularia sp. IAM M-261]
MNTELRNILTELKELTQNFPENRATNLTANILSYPQSQEYVLLVTELLTFSAFKAWTSNFIEGEATEIHLDTLVKDPTSVINIPKVIVVLECGKLLDADTVNILNAAILNRPLLSYAIVLSNAELITNEEDLALIERGTKRLFVSDNNTKEPQLIENQIFLWSDNETNNFLNARLTHDKQALQNWLTQRLACQQEFERYLALSLVNLAQECLDSTISNKTIDNNSSVKELTKAAEEITNCQRALNNWLISDLTNFNSQLATSLQTVKQNLLQGIEVYLKQNQNNLPNPTIMTRYIESGINQWKLASEIFLAQRSQQIIANVKNILTEVNWSVVNQMLQQHQQEVVILDSSLQQLKNTINSSIQNIFVDVESGSPSIGNYPQHIFYTAGGAVAGAFIASFAERLLVSALVMPQLLPAFGAMAGATLVTSTLNHFQKVELLQKYTAASVTTITEIVSYIETQLAEQHSKITVDYQQILTRLQAVIETIHHLIDAQNQKVENSNFNNKNDKQLASLRQKILNM